jgi:hypothetical protein
MLKKKNSNKINKIAKKETIFDAVIREDQQVRSLYNELSDIEYAANELLNYSLLDRDPQELLREYLSNHDDEVVIRYLELQEKTGSGFIELSVEQYKADVGYQDEDHID